MGTNKRQSNKDKFDYDKKDPFGRENPGKGENETTGYGGKKSSKSKPDKKGNGLEEYSEDNSEWREKSNWNPDDFESPDESEEDENK